MNLLQDDASTVLVVDDTHENLRLLAKILKEHGYIVRLSPEGPMALESVWANPPDLILLDILMPGMDGYAVCEALKADSRSAHIPVIFISALNDVFDKVRAFNVGGVDYVTKPFQVEEILARVKTQLMIQQTNRQLSQINKQLSHSIDELEQRNLEMQLLTRMSSALQRSETPEEAMVVGLPYLEQLFHEGGIFYLLNTTTGCFEKQVSWGVLHASEDTLNPMYCPIASDERLRLMTTRQEAEPCSCTLVNAPLPILCMQLKTRNDLIGMLYLPKGPTRHDSLQHRTRLATMVADHYALALYNIRLYNHLHEQAIRDPLTGLYNRRFLQETLSREIKHAQRHQRTLGVMLLDIDHFKHFNDTYGHDGGDEVLRQLGNLLRSIVRGSDVACRYGGEEMLLVLPEATLEDVQHRAEQLCQSVRAMAVQHQGRPLPRITISVGVSSFPDHGNSAEAIITAADLALYAAKAQGRDRVVVA